MQKLSYRATTMLRHTTGALLLLIALNAFGGGIYGMLGAKGIPVEWLRNSPFNTYFIPSAILFFCVGGSALLASLQVLGNKPNAVRNVTVSVFILVVWITAQLLLIGYVSWLQPAMILVALVLFFLNRQLKKNDQ